MNDALRWLKPTTRSTEGALREQRFVRAMRVVVPVVALGILAVALVWAEISPDTDVKETADLSQVQNTLETARFTSVDAEGRPYVIEADHVVQQDPSTMTAVLSGPRGEITLQPDNILSVTAKDGVYDHPNQKLHLDGDVVVQQNKDMTLETQKLDVDLITRAASSDQPVTGHSESGDALDAQGLSMTPGAGIVTFKGPAKLILAPEQKAKTP